MYFSEGIYRERGIICILLKVNACIQLKSIDVEQTKGEI